MKATDLLMQEHRLIERALNVLELGADTLQQGRAVPSRFFVELGEFLLGFADGSHHRKEGVLFRAMIAGGARPGDGAIALLTLEHEEGRSYSRALLDAARLMEKDPAARTAVIRLARNYITLLRGHIESEDGMVFPMADQMIAQDRHEQVWADCRRIDEGDATPVAWAAVLERLEVEARGFAPPA